MWWELAVLVLAVVASYWIGRFSMMLNLMRELQQLEPEDRVPAVDHNSQQQQLVIHSEQGQFYAWQGERFIAQHTDAAVLIAQLQQQYPQHSVVMADQLL